MHLTPTPCMHPHTRTQNGSLVIPQNFAGVFFSCDAYTLSASDVSAHSRGGGHCVTLGNQPALGSMCVYAMAV